MSWSQDGWARWFWRRLLWGLFVLPILAVVLSLAEGRAEELNPPVIAAMVLWEAVVLMLMKRKRVWPMDRRG